ncbi:hypothetical protein HDU99_001103 [Rhizoclosmatium hyalinum]|nr:hypothetical protein HDU99_001103 [Rhizoclosmatium hyalinum]
MKGSVHYQVRTSFGWNELRPAEMIVHARKKLVGFTLVEENGMVNTFTISKMFGDEYLAEGLGGFTTMPASKSEGKQDSAGGVEDEEGDNEQDRILTITTTTHSVRIVTDSTGQTANIRQQLLNTRDEKSSAAGSMNPSVEERSAK